MFLHSTNVSPHQPHSQAFFSIQQQGLVTDSPYSMSSAAPKRVNGRTIHGMAHTSRVTSQGCHVFEILKAGCWPQFFIVFRHLNKTLSNIFEWILVFLSVDVFYPQVFLLCGTSFLGKPQICRFFFFFRWEPNLAGYCWLAWNYVSQATLKQFCLCTQELGFQVTLQALSSPTLLFL